MEKKFNAPIEKVFALLTDPKWLEVRCLALGELSAKLTEQGCSDELDYLADCLTRASSG